METKDTMKAALCRKYGPPEVLEIKEVKKPVMKKNQVMVKVHATTVTAADRRVRGFNVPSSYWIMARLAMGILKPRNPILGLEFSGTIVDTGESVRRFQKGQKVFGMLDFKFGAYAEYCVINENGCIDLMPQNLSMEESSAILFGGTTALLFLRRAHIRENQNILIYGASGCVGTYAVQLAKYFGANVTAVCSTQNMEMVKSLGADRVIDYTKEDFAKENFLYDIVFDAVGKASIPGMISSLKPKGKYVHIVAAPATRIRIGFDLIATRKKLVGDTAMPKTRDVSFLKTLAENGSIRPVIDRTYPLEEIAEAHRYADLGHKKGNVVVTI